MLRFLVALALLLTGLTATGQAAVDRGIVTVVGKYTITIQNGDGKSTTYKVERDLVENTRKEYSSGFPNRFSEVSQGCKVDVLYKREGDELIITDIEVKEAKEKDKDKDK
jgi:hypothetical protein